MPIRRLHPLTLGLMLWGLFIVYGTMLPFNFSEWAGMEVVRAKLEWELSRRPSLPDVVSNLLLFFPWGLLLAARLAVAGRRLPFSLFAATGSGLLLSLGVELAQLFLPSRSTAAFDVLMNSGGAFCGAAAGFVLARRFYPHLAPLLRRGLISKPFLCLALATLAVMLLLALEPFTPSLDVGDLKRAVREARLIPWGATIGGTVPPLRTWSSLEDLLSWVLVGGLFALAFQESGKRGGAGLVLTLVAVALVATGLEAAQIAIDGRTTDATTVLLALAGAGLGGGAVLLTPRRSVSSWLTPALLLWCVTLALYRWTPPRPVTPEELPVAMFVPFYYYYARTDVTALADVMREMVSFVPLGLLLGARGERWSIGHGLATGLAVGLVLEIGQLFNAARTADITDALSAAAGAGLGVWLWQGVIRLRQDLG